MNQLIVDQIEKPKGGIIQIRLRKLSSSGGDLGLCRTSIEIEGDIDAQLAAFSAHMGAEGFSPISDVDIARIKTEATGIPYEAPTEKVDVPPVSTKTSLWSRIKSAIGLGRP